MQCFSACDRLAEFLLSIRCMWFNNNSTDEFCHKTVRSIANENSAFCLRSQHVFQIIF
uniref:Uncharacterized protein n=1 Tax=Meloidogyne enterolobii TaxID=390850 RepID=A0A6V7WR84_MELEN|nr:unnamed protein product [Meloidogyne enterolobii]